MADTEKLHGRLKYDIFFKKIFHQKHILKAFLNAALASELSSPIADLSYKPTDFIIKGKARLIQETKHDVIDVFCITEQNQRILVELQKGTNLSAMARFLDYQCRNYSSQFATGAKYDTVVPCYSICWFFDLQPPHKRIKEKISLQSDCKKTDWHFAWEIIALYPKNIPRQHLEQQRLDQLEEWLLLDVVQESGSAHAIQDMLRTEEVKEAFQQLDLSGLSEEQLRRVLFEEHLTEHFDLFEEKLRKREQERNLEIAKQLLAQQVDLDVIASSTGISRKELQRLV
jgi:predicted transposase/invertase (TIGR01784 family)